MRAALRLPLLLLALLPLLGLHAQQDETVYRLELGGGAGMGFAFTDLDSRPAPAAALVARFPLNPRMAVKAQASLTGLKGGTANLHAFYPANPNAGGSERLDFQASGALYGAEALYELHFLPYGYERDYRGYARLTPYVQLGFGLTYGTAGKAFSPHIPLGVGLKYKVARRLNLGLDWVVRFTLSDKMDGLKAPLGIDSSGFRNKDHYSGLSLTLTYDLNPRCPTCNRDE